MTRLAAGLASETGFGVGRARETDGVEVDDDGIVPESGSREVARRKVSMGVRESNVDERKAAAPVDVRRKQYHDTCFSISGKLRDSN